MQHENNKNKVIKFPQKHLPSTTTLDPYFYQRQLEKAKNPNKPMTAAELKGFQKGIQMAQTLLNEEIANQSPKRGA